MTADSAPDLVEALVRFLREAAHMVNEDRNPSELQQPSLEVLAQSLAALPACRAAGTAAAHAAQANGYEVSSLPRRRADKPTAVTGSAAGQDPVAAPFGSSGRPLDADALVSTGIAAMLLDRPDLGFRAVAENLAGYLAGPRVDIWDYAILDGNLITDEPMPVTDRWELITPTSEQLHALLSVPATADYQPDRPFKPDDYAHLTMLRRVIRDAQPHYGHNLRFDILSSLAIDRPAHPLWQPLLALSLFENSVLQLWARYQVEPGRRIDKLFDSVEWEIWTPDGEVEIEQPRTGEFGSEADVPMLRRFLTELAPRLERALDHKGPGIRLRRSAEHFLSAGEHAHGQGEVLSELNAEAVLHYVIALEGLLAGADPDRGEFIRKVSQRAAVLAGRNDAERLNFARIVRQAYDVRSKYAHGGMPEKELDLPRLRRVVRRCLLARVVLGDPTQNGPLHEVADQGLLARDTLERCIRQPVSEFRQRVVRA
jgi:hypothetical protein